MFSENTGLKAQIGYSLTSANPLNQIYYGNNFQWENDFAKNGIASANVEFFMEKYFLAVGADMNLLHNYIIYGYDAKPKQINSANIVVDVYANKTFNFWKFHWFNEVAYQYIKDKEYVCLPDVVAYSSLFFKTDMFNKALALQIGLDAKFTSNYYGYAYMPATGVFYIQNEKKFGCYPNLGVYVGAKIKRFRVFGKLSNYNSSFMQPRFYSLHRIPENPMAFNFGISWEFYD